MGLLTCGCLNVKIHVKSTDLKQVDAASIDGANEKSTFFHQRLATAQLNLEGIEQVHLSLVTKKRQGSWEVYRCNNCQIFTHATHVSQPSHLLVNLCLHSDITAIAALEKSADFSPLFKIVLRDINANRVGTLGVESEKYESLQQVLTTVQQQLNKFLIGQEADTEARIKRYEEQQRGAFAELQRKARQDKNVMIHMILSAEQPDKENAARGDSPRESLVSRSPRLTGGQSDDETDSVHPLPVNVSHITAKATVGFQAKPVSTSADKAKVSATKSSGLSTRSTSALTQKLSAPQRHKPKTTFDPEAALFADDPLFGDSAATQPFYHSDDEQEDTDDSEVDTPPPQLNMFSTSVPISVPTFTMKKKITFADENQGDPVGSPDADPDDIAASIKALARSVHGDGKDIFGELPRRPRPRFNPAADFSNM